MTSFDLGLEHAQWILGYLAAWALVLTALAACAALVAIAARTLAHRLQPRLDILRNRGH